MIPVFEPEIGNEEISEVVNALKQGEISGSFGEYIPKFEKMFAEFVGCKHGVAVTSGTTALHLAISALNLKAGDEVLVSASTNIATALAVYHNNLIPVPVDSEMTTWNLDLDLVEKLITPKTKAIIPVHLFGHPVDMTRLKQICDPRNIAIIEDCAESHGAKWDGQVTGSFGLAGCFSFYANKIITTGEGGMITTNDDAYAEKLRLLRNLAFTKPRFWHDVPGYNFRMTGMQAALGVAQTRRINSILDNKRRVAHLYNHLFKEHSFLTLPTELPRAYNVYWMYGILINDLKVNRDAFMQKLTQKGVDTRTFFCPMDQQPFIKPLIAEKKIECHNGDYLWKRGLYLPSSHTLTDNQIQEVAQKVIETYKEMR